MTDDDPPFPCRLTPFDPTVAPALDHVLITRSAVSEWRRQARYPKGRIGIFFGVSTGVHFCDGLNPLDYDFYPVPSLANGFVLFEKGAAAYRAFRSIGPDWEIIF